VLRVVSSRPDLVRAGEASPPRRRPRRGSGRRSPSYGHRARCSRPRPRWGTAAISDGREARRKAWSGQKVRHRNPSRWDRQRWPGSIWPEPLLLPDRAAIAELSTEGVPL